MAPEDDRILRVREVSNMISLSRTSLYTMIGRGEFPAPRRIGRRVSGWKLSEVIGWINAQPQELSPEYIRPDGSWVRRPEGTPKATPKPKKRRVTATTEARAV